MLRSLKFCFQSLRRNTPASLFVNYRKYDLFFRSNLRQAIHLKHNMKPTFSFPLDKSKKILLGFSIVGLMNFLNIDPEKEDSELIKIIKLGEIDLSRGDYNKAERLFHVALHVAQELRNEDAVTYIFDRLANIAFDTNKNDKARKLFIKVMQRLLAKGMDKEDLIIIHISFKIAKIFESINDYEQAEVGYQYCLKSIKNKLNKECENSEDAIDLCRMIMTGYAYFLFTLNKFTESFEYFKKAYDINVESKQGKEDELIFLLNNMGTVCRQNGDTENALKYLLEAEEIGKKFPDLKNFSFVYLNLGYLYLENKMLKEAKRYCRKALINAKRHVFEEGFEKSEECLKQVLAALKE